MWSVLREQLAKPAPLPAMLGLLGLLAVSLCTASLDVNAQPAAAPASGAVRIIAHRGGAGLYPENSLTAIRHAIALGVDAIEIDVQISKDGVPVVYHDLQLKPEITRGPDGAWLSAAGPAIKDLSVAELKAYDIGRLQPGSDYAARYASQRPVDGERVPTLAEVIDLLQENIALSPRLWIEIKTDPTNPDLSVSSEAAARAVVDVLRDKKFMDRAAILAFDWNVIVEAHALEPRLRLVCLTIDPKWLRGEAGGLASADEEGLLVWRAGIDVEKFEGSEPAAAAELGATGWSAYHGDINALSLTHAENLGVFVSAWTVNESGRALELIALGVNGITTDRPDVMLSVLGRR